ncbi:MAG: restriction endonuclease [Nitrosomonadaceae bacterium]|nr:restriction endonuclease [Nitrosomonadaceae bacterium]
MPSPQWKKFEMLVAALHEADAQGTIVKWNEQINGRQFDVVVRFSVGTYDYLTVIECKDQTRPVPVSDVEAFVIKARDAGADKAVVVSSSNFQKGAFEVANRHHIELFSLAYLQGIPEELLSDDFIPCIRIYNVRFRKAQSDEWILLPEDRNLPPYLEGHLTVNSSLGTVVLKELLDEAYKRIESPATAAPQEHSQILPPGSEAYLPHLCLTMPVAEMRFTYKIDSLRALKQPGIDPALVSGSYEYRDLRTGQVKCFPRYALIVKHDTVLREGRFYYSPSLEYSYFCHRMVGNTASIFLVESYQHGELFQSVFRMLRENQKYYVEITDSIEIERLRRIGANLFRSQGVV